MVAMPFGVSQVFSIQRPHLIFVPLFLRVLMLQGRIVNVGVAMDQLLHVPAFILLLLLPLRTVSFPVALLLEAFRELFINVVLFVRVVLSVGRVVLLVGLVSFLGKVLVVGIVSSVEPVGFQTGCVMLSCRFLPGSTDGCSVWVGCLLQVLSSTATLWMLSVSYCLLLEVFCISKGIGYTIVQAIPSCGLYRPSGYTIVQAIPSCRLYPVQAIPSCRLYRPADYTIIQAIPSFRLYHRASYTVLQTIPSCRLYRHSCYTIIQAIPSFRLYHHSG